MAPQGSGAGQIPDSEKVCWISGPPTISFPLSAFAPDPHLRLIGYCLASSRLTSSLDPRLPIGIRPSVSCVWSSPASTQFPFSPRLHPMFFRRSSFHIVRGLFLDQFHFRVPHRRSGPPQSLPCTRTVRMLAHVIPCPIRSQTFSNLSRAVWSCHC